MSYALFITVVALTFLRPFDLWFPGPAEYRPMLLLMLASLLVTIMTPSGRKQVADKAKPLVLLFLFWLAIILSLLLHGLFGNSVDAAENFAPSAIIFIIALANVDSVKRLKAACAVTALSTVAVALLGIASFHTGYMAKSLILPQLDREDSLPYFRADATSPAEENSGAYLYRIRGAGILNDPNDFGQAMIVALPLLAVLHQRGRRWRSLFVVGIPAVILVYAIYLTQSRGAILGMGALILLALRQRLGNVLSIVMLAAGGAVGLAMGLGGSRGFSASEESASERIDAWGQGLSLLRQNPVFGIGYGRFSDFNVLTAHNSFVLCFAELGMVGYFIWMGLLVLAVKGLIRARGAVPPETEEHRCAGLLLAALVGFLVCAFFLSRTYVANYFLLLALCLCAWHFVRDSPMRNAPTVPMPPIRWAGLSLFLIVATVVSVLGIIRLT